MFYLYTTNKTEQKKDIIEDERFSFKSKHFISFLFLSILGKNTRIKIWTKWDYITLLRRIFFEQYMYRVFEIKEWKKKIP